MMITINALNLKLMRKVSGHGPIKAFLNHSERCKSCLERHIQDTYVTCNKPAAVLRER